MSGGGGGLDGQMRGGGETEDRLSHNSFTSAVHLRWRGVFDKAISVASPQALLSKC